ncbi:MAG: LysE family translocator [Desulfosarcinaceae bacterium]
MFGIDNYGLFLVSSLLLHLSPGQDTLYILGRCMAQGRRAGVVSVAGIGAGVLVHTMLAALGLSVVLATSAMVFNIVKYAGAAYLVWMGIGLLRKTRADIHYKPEQKPNLRPWKLFHQGMLTNALNPKVALFFLSFLPQFVNPGSDLVFLPFMLLGLSFFVTGGLYCLLLVYASDWLTGRLKGPSRLGAMAGKLTGALFIGLGIKLAMSRR